MILYFNIDRYLSGTGFYVFLLKCSTASCTYMLSPYICILESKEVKSVMCELKSIVADDA